MATIAPPSSVELARGTEAAALASIVTWSQDCPVWHRDALRRLCERGQLEAGDIDALLAICKREAEGVPLALDNVRDPAAGLATVALRGLHSVQHVNAIVPDQRLSFDRIGVTVVYGDNGSGKSGYARILKKVCRARSAGREETILANIYDANPGIPSAVIDFTSNGRNDSAAWTNGQPANALLSAVSVFDARTANVHISQTNDVAYTPLPLRIFAALAEACQTIKTRLNNEIGVLQRQTPVAISQPTCGPGTEVGKLIAGLKSGTPPADVERLATLSEAERNRLDKLNGDLAADPARTAGRLLALKERVDGFVTGLEAFAIAVSDESAQRLRENAAALDTARAAAAAASTALFASEPLPNIGSDTWRALWEAARAYSTAEAYPERPFPATDNAVCVLCQQDLDAPAADRMNRFEAFVKDESKRREAEAKAAYEDALKAFREGAPDRSEFSAMVACLRDEVDEALAGEVRRAALLTLRRHRRIDRRHAADPVVPFPPGEEPPLAKLRAQAVDLTVRATGLTAEAGSEARRALTAERDELADRLWLQGIKGDVLAEISRRKEITALETAAKETATNRITTKSTEIAQQLVTNALRSQFAREVARLEIASLAIELKQERSNYGIPKFKVALTRKPEANVGEVLSEGEHRAVALAAFMAELATTDSRSAIVFDDPVSSLDHMHRDAVAKRLAAEGKFRQIIVFTHDIAFLFMLDEACRGQDPPTHFAIRSISRGEDRAGYCNDNPPLRARPLANVIAGMQSRLDNERRHFEGNQAEWETTVRSLQEQLRTTWERAVEEIVSPVLKRLSNKVTTPGLAQLTAITLDDCRTMRAAFGRCSALLHSEAAPLNRPLPHPDVVEAEITALREWVASVQGRQRAINPV